MDPLIRLLAGAGAAAGFLLALLNIREKLWPRPPKAHPLEAVLREIADAVRRA